MDEKQRAHYSCDALKDYILHKTPVLVGVQYNGCYAVYYKYDEKKGRFIRMILDIKIDVCRIDIVTFYITTNVPVIK